MFRLTLTGIMLILLIVSRVEGGLTVVIATIIVGSVVAGDRFLLAATALWTGRPSADVLDIYSKLSSDEATRTAIQPPQSDPTIQLEAIARRLAEKAEMGSETEISERFALVLQQEYVEQLAGQVRELEIDTPLSELSLGGDSWRSFAETFGEFPAFQDDMVSLRRLGIATFQANEFANAELTNLGSKVYEQLDIRITGPEELPRQEVSDSDDTMIADLDIDSTTRVRFEKFSNKWFRFEMDSPSALLIETQDSDTNIDPELLLYLGSDLMTEVARNDDSRGLESRIEETLQAGEYLIEIRNFNSHQAGSTFLSVRRVEEE